MVLDEHGVVAATNGLELIADVIAHHTQHDGKGEGSQQEDGVHQDEAGGVVFRQHVDTCRDLFNAWTLIGSIQAPTSIFILH